MNTEIRNVRIEDVEALKEVLNTIQLFPSEYLDEMISDYLNNSDTQDIWFTYFDDNRPVAIGYCIPEKFTQGTYNLLAIGVKAEWQSKGIASKMLNYIEQLLIQKKARVLIVETSSDDAQIPARKLYEKVGYTKEAVIRGFWNEGEDKIIFLKKL